MTHISRLSVKNGAGSQTGLKVLERARWSKWLGGEPVVRFCVLGQGLYDLNCPPESEERALELIYLFSQPSQMWAMKGRVKWGLKTISICSV